MTPERKEEHKQSIDRLADVIYSVGLDEESEELREIGNDLLAALEEAEQELKRDREWTEYWHEKELKVRMQLAEAQQTIARQREAIKWYELGKPELAWAALKEGAKEA